VEYIAFGEVLFEEHSSSFSSPYLFNGKELDRETNLSYFGARYYDAKVSLWLNVDPLADYNPHMNSEHYIDGQHNGGVYNSFNQAVYSYCYQNPIKLIDPNGKQTLSPMLIGNYAHRALSDYIRRMDPKEIRWKSERGFKIYDIGLRPDIQYSSGGTNSVWELKPLMSSIVGLGAYQAKAYADGLTFATGEKYSTGSSNGAPYPLQSGEVLTDAKSGNKFEYTIPIGKDGAIYYTCLTCNKTPNETPQEVPVTSPFTVPNISNDNVNNAVKVGTGLMILNILDKIISRFTPAAFIVTPIIVPIQNNEQEEM
jgi:RHS repeat-associated protein